MLGLFSDSEAELFVVPFSEFLATVACNKAHKIFPVPSPPNVQLLRLDSISMLWVVLKPVQITIHLVKTQLHCLCMSLPETVARRPIRKIIDTMFLKVLFQANWIALQPYYFDGVLQLFECGKFLTWLMDGGTQFGILFHHLIYPKKDTQNDTSSCQKNMISIGSFLDTSVTRPPLWSNEALSGPTLDF